MTMGPLAKILPGEKSTLQGPSFKWRPPSLQPARPVSKGQIEHILQMQILCLHKDVEMLSMRINECSGVCILMQAKVHGVLAHDL